MTEIEEYLGEIRKYPILTEEEEIELGKRILDGDESAEQELVLSNLRLVVFLSKPYIGKGLDLMDLIQQGNIGLIEAASRYDYRMGCRFGTYAGHYIKKYFTAGLTNSSRLIRLPANVVADLQIIKTATANYTQNSDKDPDVKDLTRLTGLSEDYINEINSINTPIVSLSQPLDDADETFLEDIIPDPSEMATEEASILASQRTGLLKVLDTLTPREKEIIMKRFGFDNGIQKSLEEVGALMGLTKERVRQIEVGALTKMRQPVRKKMIQEECFG